MKQYQNETWTWNMFEYFDQEDAGSSCIKMLTFCTVHSTLCKILTIMSIAAECCWDALFADDLFRNTFKRDEIYTDGKLSFSSVILSGVGWLASLTTVNRCKQTEKESRKIFTCTYSSDNTATGVMTQKGERLWTFKIFHIGLTGPKGVCRSHLIWLYPTPTSPLW